MPAGLSPVQLKSLAALLLSPLTLLANTQASTEDYSAMSLKELMSLEVFTSASLLPTPVSKAPGTVYSFTRKDFSRYGVRRLEDLLQFVPGMQLNQYRKRHQSVWARGLLDRYNDKLVLMVDGVRVRHLYYSHFSLGDNLPLENIDRVEVILGPASSLYGSNAFGGIISVTTRSFSDKPGIEATVEAGNHSRTKATATYNSSALQVFGSTLSQDAPFREDRKSFIGGQVLQPLDEDYSSIQFKARPLDGLTLKLNYSENNTPFLFIPDTQDAFIEERMLTAAASYEQGDLATGRLEANLFYSNDKAREFELEQQTRQLGYTENQNGVLAGGVITGLKQIDDHVLALGASWNHERAEDMNFSRFFYFSSGFLDVPETGSLLQQPDIRNDDVAFYAQDVWTLNPHLEITLGGRYDDFEQFGDYFNYRSALVYTPDDRQTWKLMYGTAIRTPSFREYLKVLENTDFVAPIANSERIKSLEMGYLYQWEEANLSLNLFHNEIKDFIFAMPTPDGGDEFFSNLRGNWQACGLETLVNLRPMEHLNLRLGAGYLNVEGPGGMEAPYVADWNASFTADYSYREHQLIGLSLYYNNARSDTNSFASDNADAFVIANLFASGRITDSLDISAGIDNLFNTRVYDPASDFGSQYNTERSQRQLWLKLEWSYAN